MSPVTVLPKPSTTSTKVSRTDHMKPVYQAPSDRTKAGPEITHAWSIGVTDAGRFTQNEPRQETCPPEVYIG